MELSTLNRAETIQSKSLLNRVSLYVPLGLSLIPNTTMLNLLSDEGEVNFVAAVV